jgi:hypothetical protein
VALAGGVGASYALTLARSVVVRWTSPAVAVAVTRAVTLRPARSALRAAFRAHGLI